MKGWLSSSAIITSEWTSHSFSQPVTVLNAVDQSRWKDPPQPPAGGLTYAQGPHVTYEKKFLVFFNVFKIFVKIFVHNEIY